MEKTLNPGSTPLRHCVFEANPIGGNKRRFDILGASREEMGSALHYLHKKGGGVIKLVWEVK
jgi:hypothetical protein